ncbi:MAG: pseudaminic acid synthase [Candidatus Omnitrophica bacterium]|nr:pseudaminic acid synthase [Candidatus Omnitrophota bacterium]
MFYPRKDKNVVIIAEISANHGQSLPQALRLIREAKKCGADAVKFQAYTPDALTIDADNKYFRIKHPEWGGQTLYQLYQKAYTPFTWFKRLKREADDQGIVFFATAFDRASVDMLEEIHVPIHKIASFELVDLPLIAYAARTAKPLIMSTGMASLAEIREAVDTARKNGAKEVALFKCVSSYPADPAEMNLRTIPDMQRRFRCPVGLSDHTLGVGVALASVALGAVMIEKHFTFSRKHKTPDCFFSIEPAELKELAAGVRLAELALGAPCYELTPGQKKSAAFRRSLFAVRDIAPGEVLTEGNVRSIRPAQGLAPKYFNQLLGCKALGKIKKGTPLRWELVSGRSS